MNNPLILDSSTASGRRFTAHLTSFQSSGTSLHQGIFSSDGYCTHCGITSPHHFDKICCAMCRRAYHTVCLLDGMGRGTVAAVVKNPSLWWFCLECLFVFNSSEVITPPAPVSATPASRGSGKVQAQMVPLPIKSRGMVRKTKVSSRDQNHKPQTEPQVNASAFEDELQVRLSRMESQIYNRLKSDMCRSLSQLSLAQPEDGDVDDSYDDDESDLQSLEDFQLVDSGIGAKNTSRNMLNGPSCSDNEGEFHGDFSSSSGFSESQSSSKSNSFDKKQDLIPNSSSTPKPGNKKPPTPRVPVDTDNSETSNSLSSSRPLSRTCPQLNQLDTTTENETPRDDDDSDTPRKISTAPPRSSAKNKNSSRTSDRPGNSSRVTNKSGSTKSGAPIQESKSAVFTPPRSSTSVSRGGTPRNSRPNSLVDLTVPKK